MKKSYIKPEIVFENFSLSTNIAAGCEITDPQDPQLLVPLPTGNAYLFTESCSYNINNIGGESSPAYDGICYHVLQDKGNSNIHTS